MKRPHFDPNAPEHFWIHENCKVAQVDARRHPVFEELNDKNEAEVLAAWRRHGYFLLRLAEEDKASVKAAAAFSRDFFALSNEEKEAFRQRAGLRCGYSRLDDLGKESMQLRLDPAIEKSIMTAPEFAPWVACFSRLKALATRCTAVALGSQEKAAHYAEAPGTEIGDGALSNFTTIRYAHALRSAFHSRKMPGCPLHSDAGLVSVLPQGSGASGVHVYDKAHNEWVAPDAHGRTTKDLSCVPQYCLVFGGETLQHLTGQKILAAQHEVSLPVDSSAARISVFSHLLPRSDAPIPHPNHDSTSTIRADRFVTLLSQSRQSSTYKTGE